MPYIINAACMCNTGKKRKNNEDNFYFDGRCLEYNNTGLKHPVTMTKTLQREICVAVFDGMGGEEYGEIASFAAADNMKNGVHRLRDYVVPEKRLLKELCTKLNNAVVDEQKRMNVLRMGTTMVLLCFSHKSVYVCNLGDSRAYRLRDGEFLQVSKDHVEESETKTHKKAPLNQYLGIDPEVYIIEPYIAKGDLKSGDRYLLCSDGLTDMLTNIEIDAIMESTFDVEKCAEKLVDAALEKGGRDNITVIVCRVS